MMMMMMMAHGALHSKPCNPQDDMLDGVMFVKACIIQRIKATAGSIAPVYGSSRFAAASMAHT
jgi:hypothetical protein